MTSCARSKTTPVRAPAPAAGSSPPTPWPRRRIPGHLAAGQRAACRRLDPRKDEVGVARPACRSWSWCGATCVRARSSRAGSLRMPSPAWPRRGGSTNAVLHLLAMARKPASSSPSTISTASARETPLLCDLKPAADSWLPTFIAQAAFTLVQRLKQAAFCTPAHDGHRPDAWRRAAAAVETPGQEVVRPLDRPIKPTWRLW